MKKATLFITVISTVICMACLIAVHYYEKGDLDKIYLNLAYALFGVFLSVILVNLLIDKALEKEKKWIEDLEKAKSEEQKRIEIKKWNDTIQPFLLQAILNTVLASFNILKPTYEVINNKVYSRWDNIDVGLLQENILRFYREKQNYQMYFGWFIDKMELPQTILYHGFEKKFDTLEYWLQGLFNNSNKADLHRLMRGILSLKPILDSTDQLMSDDHSMLLKKVATEILGVKKQTQHLVEQYETDTHYIEVEALVRKDDIEKRDWKMEYSIMNFFRAKKIFEEYAHELNIIKRESEN